MGDFPFKMNNHSYAFTHKVAQSRELRLKDIPKHGLLKAAGTDLHPATGYHSPPNSVFHSASHLLKSFSEIRPNEFTINQESKLLTLRKLCRLAMQRCYTFKCFSSQAYSHLWLTHWTTQDEKLVVKLANTWWQISLEGPCFDVKTVLFIDMVRMWKLQLSPYELLLFWTILNFYHSGLLTPRRITVTIKL